MLFLTILTCFRFLWIWASPHAIQPQLVKGVLDLRNNELNQDKLLTLKGQWEFYPNTLLPTFNKESLNNATPKKYIQWNEAINNGKKTAFGYGSYRLRILVDKNEKQSYSILISGVRTSSEIYINGELLGSSGSPSADK